MDLVLISMMFFKGLLAILIVFFVGVAYITISFYWLTPRRINKIMQRQGVRGPKPRFLVGNIVDAATLNSSATSHDMDSVHHNIVSRLYPHYVLWSNLYGKQFIHWVGSEPRMCLTDIGMIKELLSSKYTKLSGRSWTQQQNSKHFIGRGLLMANGEEWYHPRHILSPEFVGDKLKNHVVYMVKCTEEMLQQLQLVVESGKCEVEISDYMVKLTADIISRTEFDSSYENGKQIFHLLMSLQHLVARSNRHSYLPGSRFFPSKFNRKIKELKMEVEKLLMEIIQSRKNNIEIGRSTSYGNDLLGMLLAETQKKRDDGFNFDLQLVMDECKTFFFAGHDTNSVHLTWTIMLLATNHSWQEKVRTEVLQVCNGETPSIEHLSKFTMLNMVINESLRLYPPVSLIPRMAFEDFKLGDLYIPKGLSISIPTLLVHHSEEQWGKDAHEFKPQRFEGKAFAAERLFLPFSLGPRNCIGQMFALMETKIALAMLISRFSFTLSKNYRHAPVSVITLKPKHGVQICLEPLKPTKPMA